MTEVYNFKGLVIYIIDKLLNFKESVANCRQLDSKLLNFVSLNKKSVYDNVKQNVSSSDFREYRILSLQNNSVDCFSLLSFQPVNPRYPTEICRNDFEFDQKYFTLCEKTTTESMPENESINIVVIVLIIVIILLGICAAVLFVFRQKIFARFYRPIVVDDVDRNSYHVGFSYSFPNFTFMKLNLRSFKTNDYFCFLVKLDITLFNYCYLSQIICAFIR